MIWRSFFKIEINESGLNGLCIKGVWPLQVPENVAKGLALVCAEAKEFRNRTDHYEKIKQIDSQRILTLLSSNLHLFFIL